MQTVLEMFYRSRHDEDALALLCRDYMPRGSGVDAGTHVDRISDTSVTFHVDWHHMNEHGYYVGWYAYKVRAFRTLDGGIEVKIKGPDLGGVRDYLSDLLYDHLSRMPS